MENLILKINQIKDTLPKRQRVLCNYILENPMEASMLTIVELADKCQVGAATVIRTIQSLGFEKYNQFKAALRGSIFEKASTSYNAYWNMMRGQGNAKGDLFPILDTCEDTIKRLNTPAFVIQIERAAEKILQAKRIYLLGLRTSYPFALTLEYALLNSGLPSIQLGTRPDFLFDHISEMTPDDILISIASAPVTKTTVEAIKLCHKRGIPTVVITTSLRLSINSIVSAVINTENFDCPAFSTLTMLTTELLGIEINRRHSDSGAHLKQLDRILQENDLTVWDPEYNI